MLVALIACQLFVTSNANAFLAKGSASGDMLESINRGAIEGSLLEEVRGYMGKGRMDAQIPAIKTSLEPMWLALPKNIAGNLEISQVRYVLHRYFVQRHGWNIEGLELAGNANDEASAATILRGRVPGFLLDMFEEAFGTSGLKLHELAIFAATLEHFIHDEAAERLKAVYDALDLAVDEPVHASEADEVLDAFMYSLLLGQHKLKGNDASIRTRLRSFGSKYPGWSATQMWLRDLRLTFEHYQQGRVNPFKQQEGTNFAEMTHLAEEVSERFGKFQNAECHHLKDALLERDDEETGLVSLDEFYRAGMDSGLRLAETADYLRSQGALDENKAGVPRVIVPNYILSKGNCMGNTGFYTICCINECEGLLAQIEKAVAAPAASAKTLVAIVSQLSSSTLESSGSLPAALVQRLEHVAAKSGGSVPLHGRLFSQWLHFVFPRECPYPHMSGSTAPRTAAEWLNQTSTSHIVDSSEIAQYVDSSNDVKENAAEENAENQPLQNRWSDEDEILFQPSVLPRTNRAASTAKALFKIVIGLGGFACLTMAAFEVSKRSFNLDASVGFSKPHMV